MLGIGCYIYDSDKGHWVVINKKPIMYSMFMYKVAKHIWLLELDDVGELIGKIVVDANSGVGL